MIFIKRISINDIKSFIIDSELNIELLSTEFKNAKENLQFRCTVDGFVFYRTWDNFKKHTSCPRCGNFEKKSTEYVIDYINKSNDKLEYYSGEYVNSKSIIYIRCKEHDYIFHKTWNDIQSCKELKCPICSRKKVVTFINDLATTHPDYIKYFKNKRDSLNVSAGSTKYVELRCDICGFEKQMQVYNLLNYGFRCDVCSDSYISDIGYIMLCLDL